MAKSNITMQRDPEVLQIVRQINDLMCDVIDIDETDETMTYVLARVTAAASMSLAVTGEKEAEQHCLEASQLALEMIAFLRKQNSNAEVEDA